MKEQRKVNISVIVPAKNEEEFVEECLSSLTHQTLSPEFYEIIFVDGGSEDLTVEKARSVLERSRVNYSIISNPAGNPSAGMNLGIKHAKGKFIVRCDAHTIYEKNFLENAVKVLQETGAYFAGGHQIPAPRTFFEKMIACFLSVPWGAGGGAFRGRKEGWADTAYMGAYRKEVFEKIGRFDEDLYGAEDDTFHWLMRKHGLGIYLSHKISSRYIPTGSMWTHIKRFFRYGRGKGKSAVRYKRFSPPRQFIPPLFTLYVAGTLPALFLLPPPLFLIYLIPYFLYALFLFLLTPLKTWSRYRWAGFTAPLLFPLFHLAYGSGFFWGVIEELGRKFLTKKRGRAYTNSC